MLEVVHGRKQDVLRPEIDAVTSTGAFLQTHAGLFCGFQRFLVLLLLSLLQLYKPRHVHAILAVVAHATAYACYLDHVGCKASTLPLPLRRPKP